jgi:hypothetical protein
METPSTASIGFPQPLIRQNLVLVAHQRVVDGIIYILNLLYKVKQPTFSKMFPRNLGMSKFAVADLLLGFESLVGIRAVSASA